MNFTDESNHSQCNKEQFFINAFNIGNGFDMFSRDTSPLHFCDGIVISVDFISGT